jgi:hypothetical protein
MEGSLVCCAAGGKHLFVPLTEKDRVVDGAVFTFRSPRKDLSHLRELSLYLEIPKDKISAAWRRLPEFSAKAVARVTDLLEQESFRKAHDLPLSAGFDAKSLKRLADAYDRPLAKGLRFYDLDIRVFTMLKGLRIIAGVQSAEVLFFMRRQGTPIVRFFQRDLDPVLPVDPPIYGLCVAEDVADKLRQYILRYDAKPWDKSDEGGETLAKSVLGLSFRRGGRLPFTHTFALSIKPAWPLGRDVTEFIAVADIRLTKDYPDIVELCRACVAAASDWTDATALRELQRLLTPLRDARWEDFKILLGQIADYLEDARIDTSRDTWSHLRKKGNFVWSGLGGGEKRCLHARGGDKWTHFMRSLDDILWNQTAGPDPRDNPVVKETLESLEWLAKQTDRKKLNAKKADERLEGIRNTITVPC